MFDSLPALGLSQSRNYFSLYHQAKITSLRCCGQDVCVNDYHVHAMVRLSKRLQI